MPKYDTETVTKFRSTARQPGGSPGDRVVEAYVRPMTATINIYSSFSESERLVLFPGDISTIDALIEVLNDIRDWNE